MYSMSMLLRSALLNVFALESSPLKLLNVILPNRMEHQNEDALSEENTKLQNNERRRRGNGAKESHIHRKWKPHN